MLAYGGLNVNELWYLVMSRECVFLMRFIFILGLQDRFVTTKVWNFPAGDVVNSLSPFKLSLKEGRRRSAKKDK